MEIVLVNPEIPQNTGNIVRTCALTKTRLHLIKPLGFSLADRYLKRAGLDYWYLTEVKTWESLTEMLAEHPGQRILLATTKAPCSYHRVQYRPDDILVFGSETSGLPAGILAMFPENQIRIPMLEIGRSLNLSNSVAVVLYEALRQQNYPELK